VATVADVGAPWLPSSTGPLLRVTVPRSLRLGPAGDDYDDFDDLDGSGSGSDLSFADSMDLQLQSREDGHFESDFRIGDHARVREMDLMRAAEMASDHGGWNPHMASYFDEIGEVVDVSRFGVAVLFEDGQEYMWNPRALALPESNPIPDMEPEPTPDDESAAAADESAAPDNLSSASDDESSDVDSQSSPELLRAGQHVQYQSFSGCTLAHVDYSAGTCTVTIPGVGAHNDVHLYEVRPLDEDGLGGMPQLLARHPRHHRGGPRRRTDLRPRPKVEKFDGTLAFKAPPCSGAVLLDDGSGSDNLSAIVNTDSSDRVCYTDLLFFFFSFFRSHSKCSQTVALRRHHTARSLRRQHQRHWSDR
jgi:hypothetical protein